MIGRDDDATRQMQLKIVSEVNLCGEISREYRIPKLLTLSS